MLGAILFAISVVGIFLNRRNVIIMLMAIELMLLAVNLNFIAFSHYPRRHGGADIRVLHPDRRRGRVGDRPAILVLLFRNVGTIDVEDLGSLKG